MSDVQEPNRYRLLLFVPVAFAAAVAGEAGGDLHLPWWAMLTILGSLFITGARPMLAALLAPAAWPWLLALTALSFGLIDGAAWLGENGAERLHQPVRWFVTSFLTVLWCEGWAQDPMGAPGWVNMLATPRSRGG